MPDPRLGEPFGLSGASLRTLDFDLANRRILQDVKSDFIYAPHLSLIYARAADALINGVTADLQNGRFSPGLPLQIEVPKSFRIPVESTRRLGPAYSRPGSILFPKDRLLYQAFADVCAPSIDHALDETRSFSHQLAPADSASFFLPTRSCWNDLQAKLSEYARVRSSKYVMRLDIANYFNSINLHTLVNTLSDAGVPRSIHTRLEVLLTSFTGERSSRGILQGLFPSDLFGNFYLAPVDRFLSDSNISSARYVDDLYIFVSSVDRAEHVMTNLIPLLRRYDLSLNENKSKVLPKNLLYSMEPDLEALFKEAVDEITGQVDEDDFEVGYGFQSEWEDEEEDEEEDGDTEEDLELRATESLFDSTSEYVGQEENVERFCLPIFAKALSDYAVSDVLDNFSKRPSMSQIYLSYLSKFLDDEDVRSGVFEFLEDDTYRDWQRMWCVAAMMQAPEPTNEEVRLCLTLAQDGLRHDALRAVAAYHVGRYGDHGRRSDLRALYASTTPYVQAAIYASTRNWSGAERRNARAMWGTLSPLNLLLSEAFTPRAS